MVKNKTSGQNVKSTNSETKLEVKMSAETKREISKAAKAKNLDKSKYARSVLGSAVQGELVKVSSRVAFILKTLEKLTNDSAETILEELLSGVELEQLVDEGIDDYLSLKGKIIREKYNKAIKLFEKKSDNATK